MNGEIDCIYKDRPVRLSDSGHVHIFSENIDPMTLCDMINYNIPCPKYKKRKFRSISLEVCSNRKGKIYRIILDLSYTHDINAYAYLVTHVEPI